MESTWELKRERVESIEKQFPEKLDSAFIIYSVLRKPDVKYNHFLRIIPIKEEYFLRLEEILFKSIINLTNNTKYAIILWLINTN